MIFRPSDFRNDWYGYLTNQAGHAYLVGFPLVLAFAPAFGLIAAPIIVGVAYALIWEWVVQHGRMWRDSLEDTVHVTAGASVLAAALGGDIPTILGCMAAQGVLLGIGIWRRR